VADVAFVLHGHFYQPPRENPWTGEVPRESSAAPFHDWNQRIVAECYRPNGWASIHDEEGHVVETVNNYERLSFNVGPTLLSWLERHAPEVYARILEADRVAGRAIAQAYGHAILPLCNDRDLRTQIRWGQADFRYRFGREPEGMWLPETAVDDRVLAALAEEGVGFTILAPGQIAEIRPLDQAAGGDDRHRDDGRRSIGDPDPGSSDNLVLEGLRHRRGGETPSEGGEWQAVDAAGVEMPSVLRWRHPGDPALGVDLVVYDGSLSHDVAFGGFPSQEVIERVVGSGRQLVAVACDGETFGHHHRFAERGVAHALSVEADRRGVQVPRLADWLAEHPPTHEARVRLSAWSCAHGVDRWKADCGCHTGGEEGWSQAWRAPLRAALDLVRDAAAEAFERRGDGVLRDPWGAREAYVDVLVGAATWEQFSATHAVGDAAVAQTLLESQREALAMYASCGWFFNDLAGLETVQILRHAARCLDLLAQVGEPTPLDAMLATLAEAHSNRPEEGDGRAVWRRHVEPYRALGNA
jgi:hypothetical protein